MMEDMINEENGNRLLSILLYLDGLDSMKDVLLFINCLGGDISPSLAVYDTIKSLRCSVVTRCLGYAYDILGFILAAGKKGNRSALPHSRIILRPPIGEANGQVDYVVNEITELAKIRDHLYGQFAKHTGQSVEKPHVSNGCGFFEWIDPPTIRGSSSRVESVEQSVDQMHSTSKKISKEKERLKHHMNSNRLTNSVTNILLLLIVLLLVLMLIVHVLMCLKLLSM